MYSISISANKGELKALLSVMNYIVLDLEWNNVYIRGKEKSLNEIIEIGAVKLDSSFRLVDTYKSFIKTSVGKRLHGRVKELTHISNADIVNARQFTNVMHEFRKWSGGHETVVMTWGMTDIHVLMDNYKYFCGNYKIPFLHSYIDLQQYIQHYLGRDGMAQIGLQSAAELMDINLDDIKPHRALADSILAARCLKKAAEHDKDSLMPFTYLCDDHFYSRVRFKSYFITDLNSPEIDKKVLKCRCPYCKYEMKLISGFYKKNQSLKGIFYCGLCANEYELTLKIKRKYDSVDVKKKLRFAEAPPPKHINESKNAV